MKRAVYGMLMIGMCMTSCSDDDFGGKDDGKKDGEETYEKGYIALSVINNTIRNAGTRADPPEYGELEEGTSAENKVSTVHVVLYDATNTVAYQFPLNGSTDMETVSKDATYNNKYQTKAQEVAIKPYKLAVFVNAPANLVAATTKGASLSALEAAHVLASGVTELTTGGDDGDGFLMGNFAGLVNVPTTKIHPTAAAAVADPVAVDIERAVAKITLKDELGGSNSTMTFSNFGWVEDVVNKKTYWMRKQTLMLDGTITSGQVTGTKMETDVAKDQGDENIEATKANRVRMYAEDPNFEKTTAEGWTSTMVGSDGSIYGQPNNLGDNYIYNNDVNEIKRVSKASVYVPENTMRAIEQWEDVTTSVLIKLGIEPKATAFSSVSPGTSYYVYTDLAGTQRVFSGAELQLIANAADDTEVIASPKTTWGEFLSANPALSDLQALLNNTSAQSAILASGVTDWSNLNNVSGEYGDLKYYVDGMNYYRVPIRHFSDYYQSVKMAYGRYGVVRNNIYYLTLEKVNNYGDIDVPDPKDPDDKESFVSIKFEILQWMQRTQGIEL
ncbi:Mfa1 family fimbria major subunit [Bacteroides sp. OttesenSCG-928-E20]|nr:Mfa1 family fimbria major subunit [Bacteroides sp. OttesenSCG-928-E20]